jgi:hypothetical protein
VRCSTRRWHRASAPRRLDVAAAFEHLAVDAAVDGERLAVVGQQDTVADMLSAVGEDTRLRAAVLLSSRFGARLADAVRRRPVPVFGWCRRRTEGLRATVAAYLVGVRGASRLEVFDGLAIGTTMLSTRQFEHPDAEPLEATIADWLSGSIVKQAPDVADRTTPGPTVTVSADVHRARWADFTRHRRP